MQCISRLLCLSIISKLVLTVDILGMRGDKKEPRVSSIDMWVCVSKRERGIARDNLGIS